MLSEIQPVCHMAKVIYFVLFFVLFISCFFSLQLLFFCFQLV